MKGRRSGQSEVSIDDMSKIVRLTEEGCSRGHIAEETGRCKMTVYLWQKKLGLL